MRKHIKMGVFLCAGILFHGIGSIAQTPAYELNNIRLRAPLTKGVEKYYSCISRPELADTIQCDLLNGDSVNPGAPGIADTLIASSDGKILYAHDRYEIKGDLNHVAVSTISETSNALAGTAPRRFFVDGVIVAIWGDTKLEKIATHTPEYSELTGLVEQNYGLLVAPTGSLETTKDSGQPVYRVIGGDGLVVCVSQNETGQVTVQRFIVAAGTLTEKNFESQAHQFLARDRANPADDFSGWPEVAFMIRRLALNTTPEDANIVVDRTFGAAASKKYYSHVWAFLPTSVIKHLKMGTYLALDIFGENTEFPEIRDRIIAQLEADPAAPFSEFLLYTLGRFTEAIEFNPRSPIRTILLYAQSHLNLRRVLANTFEKVAAPGDQEILEEGINIYLHKYNYQHIPAYKEETLEESYERLARKDFFNGVAYELIPRSVDEYRDGQPSLTQYLNYFNRFPERYNSSPIIDKVADFGSLTDAILPPLEEVLKDQDSPHYDDAAYFLSWLTYHRGDVDGALDRFGNLVALLSRMDLDGSYDYVEHLDYPSIALHHLIRIFRTLPPQNVIDRIQDSEVLSSHPIVWETALLTLYRSHQYELVISGARQALRNFDLIIEDMPVTTDPRRITEFFTRINMTYAGSLQNIVYLYQSSREILQFDEFLADVSKHPVSLVADRIKELIFKYSLIDDSDLEEMLSKGSSKPRHKDLRQSIFLAGRSLELLPKNADYKKLREWLHYRRIRLLAQFDPVDVPAAIAEFSDEYPQSSILDDGLAEQIFAEAVVVGDMAKATRTFDSLRQRFPQSNALDNAHSWMAIGWTCAGEPAKALEIDQRIVRDFPLTRHAHYAQERIQNPRACYDLQQLYLWDYEALRWRERNRIDTIQAVFNAKVNTEPPAAGGPQQAMASPPAQPALGPLSAFQQHAATIGAIERVLSLIQLHTLPERQALEQLRSYYAVSVDYYGEINSLDEVMQDKGRYFDRWPNRDYRLQEYTMNADCTDGQVCVVTGYYDWSVLSTKRLKLATGAASFEYAISAQPPYLVIRETGEVVNRR